MVSFTFQHTKSLNSLTKLSKPSTEDFVLNHTEICEDNILYHTPPEQQTQEVAPYIPFPEDRREEKHS